MSIGNKKKLRQRPENATPEGERSGKAAAERKPKKRARLRLFGILLAVLAVLVGLLPTIIVHTPLMAFFVRRAAMLDGTVKFQSASIGWFSATSATGIVVADSQGETVLEADSLTCDRSLWKLIFQSANLGSLKIEKPRLTAKLSHDGSNVETLLARWLTAPSTSAAAGVDLSVELTDGEVTIVDQETQQTWHVAGLQLGLDMSRQFAWPTRLEATATIDDRVHPGSLTVKSHCKASETAPDTDGDLSLQAVSLPLAMFQRIAARAMPGLKLDGMMGSNLSAQWTGAANVKLDGGINGSKLSIESPLLGHDVFRLERMEIACKGGRQDKRATIDEAKIDCDVGTIEASGHVDLGEHGLESLADLTRQPDCVVQGTLDLARLAKLLPGTLRVRPGTEITSGQVQLSVRTSNAVAGQAAGSAPAGPAWQARLATSQITATDRGRQIRWDKPVSIDLAMHPTDQGPIVDSLTCQSDFLQVNGSGTPDQLTGTVAMNLQRLTDGLGRFVDLGGMVLAGDGSGKFQWSRNAAGDFEAGGQIGLRNFRLGTPKRQAWSEDSLTLGLGAKGHADMTSPARLDTATLQLRAGGDQSDRLVLTAKDIVWTEPANGPTQLAGTVAYQGDLALMQPWIIAATGNPNLRIGGHLSGTAQLQQAEGQIVIKNESNVEQLVIAGPSGQPFRDPQVHCVVQCSYQPADNTLKIDQCELTSAVAGARAGGQIALNAPGDMQINGDVTYQWDKINLLLQPFCGNSIQFSGGGTSPIAYRGPLSPALGQANATLQFAGANLYGIQVGPGELKAHLANGVLQCEPLEVACNQGRLTLRPEFRMNRQPMEFRLSAGTLASHIQLDQPASRSALRYVIPILEPVGESLETQSQGNFSIVLEGCCIPIGDLYHAEIAGRIIVHSATVKPGPLIQKIAKLVAANPSLVHIEPESVILFRMTRGRIYHQGLALQAPPLTMRTYGSVGLDDTLKLMVEMSMPLNLLPKNSVTDAIRNEKMQIPVGGTLNSPQLDTGEIERVFKQAGIPLPGEIGNALKGLLQPQR